MPGGGTGPKDTVYQARRVLWDPRHASWWIAVLFAIGSLCFLVAPFPGVVSVVGPTTDAIVFFVGSLFFTAAAALQLRASAASLRPHRHRGIDWWSSTVQLGGTLFFNVTTFRALTTAVDASSYDHMVWRPDAFGSVCFLVSGALAYAAAAGGLVRRPPSTREGVVAAVNLFGCVAFGFSAVGAYVMPTTGNEVNASIGNGATALGALAFLVGALLLLPQDRAPLPG
jgi:hypothetical protein